MRPRRYLDDQWCPDLAHLEGGSLYGSMLRRFRAVGGKVKGVFRRGPRLVEARVDNAEGTRIRVRFADVNGRLPAPGRVAGFSIRTAQNHPYRLIYKIEVDKASPTDILLHLTEPCPQSAFVWYGFGIDPYCNVTDEADMAVPVFAALPIER